MFKRFPKTLILFIAFLLTSNVANAYSIPKKIKIIKESGITVRRTIDVSSEKLDAVYYNYFYDVVDVNVMYYKIKNKAGVEGWIYNNSVQNWVEEIDNGKKARIGLVSGITMRSEPYYKTSGIVGLADFMKFYEILDVIFSHFKIKTPNGESGWVYAGRPNDSWVEIDVNVNEKDFRDIKKKFNNKKLINGLD